MTPHQVSEATTDQIGMLTHTIDQPALRYEETSKTLLLKRSTTDKLHKNHADNNNTSMGIVGASDIKVIAT